MHLDGPSLQTYLHYTIKYSWANCTPSCAGQSQDYRACHLVVNQQDKRYLLEPLQYSWKEMYIEVVVN
jgi:hypothetical protein